MYRILILGRSNDVLEGPKITYRTVLHYILCVRRICEPEFTVPVPVRVAFLKRLYVS